MNVATAKKERKYRHPSLSQDKLRYSIWIPVEPNFSDAAPNNELDDMRRVKVYEGEIEVGKGSYTQRHTEAMSTLFVIFNTSPPEGFEGRKLGVNDVVLFEDTGKPFILTSAGWRVTTHPGTLTFDVTVHGVRFSDADGRPEGIIRWRGDDAIPEGGFEIEWQDARPPKVIRNRNLAAVKKMLADQHVN